MNPNTQSALGSGLQLAGGVASMFPEAGTLVGAGLGIIGSLVAANAPIPVQPQTLTNGSDATPTTNPYRMAKGGKINKDPYKVMRKGGLAADLVGGQGNLKRLFGNVMQVVGKSHKEGGEMIAPGIEAERGELIADNYVIRKSIAKTLIPKLKRAMSEKQRELIVQKGIKENDDLLRKEGNMDDTTGYAKRGGKLDYFVAQRNKKYAGGGPFDWANSLAQTISSQFSADTIPSYVGVDPLLNIQNGYIPNPYGLSEKALDSQEQENMNFFNNATTTTSANTEIPSYSSGIKNNIGSTNKTQFGNFKPFNMPLTAEQAASANKGVGVQMPNAGSSMQGVGLRMPNAPELNFAGSTTLDPLKDLLNNQNKVTPPPASAFNMGNAAQALGSLVAPAYNLAMGNKPPKKVKAFYNPQEGAIKAKVNQAKLSPNALYQKNTENYMASMDAMNQSTNSAVVRRAGIQAAANQKAKADSMAYLSVGAQNANTDLQGAQILNSIGAQRAQADMLRQQGQQLNEATAQSFTSTGVSQMGQSLVNAGLMQNQNIQNAYYNELLADGLPYYQYNQQFLNNPSGYNGSIFGNNKE